MQSSAEKLFENMGRLYTNIYNLTKAFQEASSSNQTVINVTLVNEDGTSEVVHVNSFQKIMSELSRIDNNFLSTLNIDNLSYILDADGEMSQIMKTSFANAEYLSNFSFPTNSEDESIANGSECIIDLNSQIKNMVFPNVKIPVSLDDRKLNSDVSCLMFTVTDGFENIIENTSLLNLEYLISQGTVQATQEKFTLKQEKEQVKFFGKFDVLESNTSGNVSTIKLSDIKYGGLNVIGDSINLKVDDLLVNKQGTAKFRITEINNATKILKLTKISGVGSVSVGVGNLLFNEILPTNKNIVGIPVQPNKKLIVFLSTENLKTIGYPSAGIKIDTETLTVSNNDGTFTLDEYFNKYVTNISEYLISLIKETTIPISLGVKPNAPVLNELNFKVLQINRHLTDAKATKELEKLNVSKEKIKNDIDYKQNEISVIQNEVDTLKFKTPEEKNFRTLKIQNLRQDINILNGNMLTVTRELNNNAIKYGLKNVKPKYRAIGMWDIQKPIYSPLTKPQNIIKYEVQYRYLSKNIDTVDSTSYKMINDEGKEINVVISPWVDLTTRSLNKKFEDNKTVWETPVLDSVDDININQLSIAINEGESLEIRVRSISEAGYPIAPLKSEWSDILRVNFPNNLTESSLNSIVSKNEEDLKASELNSILQKTGLINHISGQVQEAEKLFLHKAEDITSGAFTAEQKNIPLSSYLRTLRNDIDLLMNKDAEEKLKIEIIDFNSEAYTVTNNSTIELSGGNYSDSFNLLDNTKFGSIIRKTGYIKIKNNNVSPLEIKTLVPGTLLDSTTGAKYYNVPVKAQDSLTQKSKQILYFRNVDITGQNEDIFRLIKPKQPNTNTFPNPTYLDGAATESVKNLVYYNPTDGIVKIGKLLTNAGNDFIAFSKEHPMFDSENMDIMLTEFERAKLYTSSLKKPIFQEELIQDGTLLTSGLGFSDNDFFAVGENSCGAFLYPIINNPNSISVIGNNTISTLIIPANTEILIPFIYEYRMIDRFGKINGSVDLTINDEVTYSKKIGIDLMINNELFKFDINVTSKLKSKVVPIETLNVSSIVGLFGATEVETIS